jgi:hypothetical protein
MAAENGSRLADRKAKNFHVQKGICLFFWDLAKRTTEAGDRFLKYIRKPRATE